MEVARANLHKQLAVAALNLSGVHVAVGLKDIDLQRGRREEFCEGR